MPALRNTRFLRSSVREAIGPFALGLFLAFNCSGIAADEKQPTPATIAEAKQVIDLATIPVGENVVGTPTRRLAQLVYRAKATIKDVFAFQKRNLNALKFKELPESQANDQAASATFARGGFVVSLTAWIPDPDMPGVALVTLTNHGNVDLSKLPVPDGARSLRASPLRATYVTATGEFETTEAVLKLLVARGWQPYGQPLGNSHQYKKNAVRMTASVNSDPAQGGKTVIEYTSDLMSVDLPVPSECRHAVYSDATRQLFFVTKQSPDDVVAFYRETLGKSEWMGTFEFDQKEFLFFRNPHHEMLTLQLRPPEGGYLSGKLTHLSSDEVEAWARLAKAESEKVKPSGNPADRVPVTLPANAQEIKITKSRVEFKLANGKGKDAVEVLRKALSKGGWDESDAVLKELTGTLVLKNKDGRMLYITYVDPEVSPVEVKISGWRVELDVKLPDKK